MPCNGAAVRNGTGEKRFRLCSDGRRDAEDAAALRAPAPDCPPAERRRLPRLLRPGSAPRPRHRRAEGSACRWPTSAIYSTAERRRWTSCARSAVPSKAGAGRSTAPSVSSPKSSAGPRCRRTGRCRRFGRDGGRRSRRKPSIIRRLPRRSRRRTPAGVTGHAGCGSGRRPPSHDLAASPAEPRTPGRVPRTLGQFPRTLGRVPRTLVGLFRRPARFPRPPVPLPGPPMRLFRPPGRFSSAPVLISSPPGRFSSRPDLIPQPPGRQPLLLV